MNLTIKQFQIGGMICVNCQKKIEEGLRNLPGVREVAVSYQTGGARIVYDTDQLSFTQIEQAINNLDYEVLPGNTAEEQDIVRVISFLVIIIALYVLLQRLGILNLLVPSQLADGGMGYSMLFVVGLLTSVHCIAMCGGINLSQCLPGEVSGGERISSPAVLYNLGRVVSYTAIGAILGFAGMLLGGNSGVGFPVLIQGILKLIAGTFMVAMGINMLGIFPWLRRLTPKLPRFLSRRIADRKASASQPFMVGLLNGLMPCGPLQSMQILALASGSPLSGGLSMFFFSLGTVPLMLGLGAIVSALGRRFARSVINVGAVLVAVLGLAMLSQGGSLSGMLLPDRLLFIVIALSVTGVAASIPFSKNTYRVASTAVALAVVLAAGVLFQRFGSDTKLVMDSTTRVVDGVQLVESTLAPGQYPTIMVQEDLPVRWTIHASSEDINGCNYKMILSAYGIEHIFEAGDNLIEFVPENTGTITYTCWMGMIQGCIVVTGI